MDQLVTMEVATSEIDSWLDAKKVSQQKRDDRADGIKILISGICEGNLTLKEDKTFVQKLKHEFGKDIIFTELEYKPRIHVGLIHQHLTNVKSDDPDGRLLAHVAALTGKPKEVLKKMDTEDFAIAQSIAYFFL
jgi:hypothetical protein